ncbi:DUF6879 family protein [Streptomyces fulvorobeus]|uniref:DUF6879 domain-containing protein n=1 Tax=Streptomyces fulvorobeus TaxID=284028 RepID=A0A7J0C2E5_9ACTN|nr:DUF6879 family protein [Streptomyces fulvorobeus]NYE40405.1 hypothetical protein [Streptomyces fulvorobeus]GFM96685.1 hypothetical protein Sfulv_14960 [Streptomyces fulvorobeus]
MPPLIPFKEITHHFAEFQHTAFRLETRRGYATDRSGARFQAFMGDTDPAPEPDHPWNVNVRAKAEQGARFSRVRIVDDPPTDGQRFLMATAAGNVDAGEDIRVLPRAHAEQLGLPNCDLWLFDSRILVRMHIDDTDTTIGVELVEDPGEVLDACRARDAALAAARPSAEVWARVRSSV